MLRSVEDASGDFPHITNTQETRHIGLYHHSFLGDNLTLNTAITDVLIMSKSHEAPSRDALWQREMDFHLSFLVTCQRRIEECCFREILTHLQHIILPIVLPAIVFRFLPLLQFTIVSHCIHRGHPLNSQFIIPLYGSNFCHLNPHISTGSN